MINPGGLIVSYQYDALGRRVKRTNGTQVEKFTYDGLDVVLNDDSVYGMTTYQNGLGIDNKLKSTNCDTVKYFLQDYLGTTTALTDQSGAITAQTNYDSFGNATSYLPTSYQYTGREKDEFSGLTYYRARWYDAQLGRFISEDPIGLAGGINPFAYVGNNSLNATDSLGLDAEYDQQVYQAQQDLIEFFAPAIEYGMGFGDNVLLGLSTHLRPADDPSLQCSAAYQAGEWTAIAIQAAEGGVGIYRAGAKILSRYAARKATQVVVEEGLTKVPNFASSRKAAEHYAKHVKGVIDRGGKQTVSSFGADMAEYRSFKGYVRAAREFHSGSPRNGILEGVRANGDFIRFDPVTGNFGVRSADNTIRTFFRPSGGMSYFLDQF